MYLCSWGVSYHKGPFVANADCSQPEEMMLMEKFAAGLPAKHWTCFLVWFPKGPKDLMIMYLSYGQ